MDPLCQACSGMIVGYTGSRLIIEIVRIKFRFMVRIKEIKEIRIIESYRTLLRIGYR